MPPLIVVNHPPRPTLLFGWRICKTVERPFAYISPTCLKFNFKFHFNLLLCKVWHCSHCTPNIFAFVLNRVGPHHSTAAPSPPSDRRTVDWVDGKKTARYQNGWLRRCREEAFNYVAELCYVGLIILWVGDNRVGIQGAVRITLRKSCEPRLEAHLAHYKARVN